jgi:arsenite methyltransferase
VSSRTVPAFAGDATGVKCACADLWSHPLAQLLAGPTLRPGGRELTRQLLGTLGLRAGARALDVGSGTGASLAELREQRLRAFGIDYSRDLAAQAAEQSPVTVGDAELLPFAAASFDAVLAECVLSALPDKHAALQEIHRVLTRHGSLVLTDMTVDGRLPEPLDSVASWVACVGGACSTEGYRSLLREHGFAIDVHEDASAALVSLVDQAARRFAMLQGAMGVGLVEEAWSRFGGQLDGVGLSLSAGGLSELAGTLFAQVRAAIDGRELGYLAITARVV